MLKDFYPEEHHEDSDYAGLKIGTHFYNYQIRQSELIKKRRMLPSNVYVWRGRESNPRQRAYESPALATELPRRSTEYIILELL